MLKNLKIAHKMTLSSGSILALLVLIAVWGIFGLSSVVENGIEVASGNSLKGELLQRELDHLNWVQKVSSYINDDSITELTVQLDHTKCGFGKWYYGEGRTEAEKILPILGKDLAAIGEPHQKLHESAGTIKDFLVEAEESGDSLMLIEGKAQALKIFSTDTQKQLEHVQEGLHSMIKLASDNIMSEDIMIGEAIKTRTAIIILSVIAFFVGILLAFFISRSITTPVSKVVDMIHEMEKGHLNTRLNMDSKDEIGQMAGTMDSFADNLQVEVVGAMEKLAAKDLTFEASPKDGDDVIRGALKKAGEDLNGIMSSINIAGDQVSTSAEQVSNASQSLSQGATEQASSLEEISSSMTEMESQTKLNAENAGQANTLSDEAKTAAENGNKQMQSMVEAMNEINEAGRNISKIIKVIDEIAFQTNLLALNAAVEAARAGSHGKGFAVVAEEVRNLAARSAKAAGETAELIEGSVEKTARGFSIAEQTAAALEQINSGVTKVSDLVNEIATASTEQAQGIAEVTQGLAQIDLVTQQNTANAEQSAAAAQELSSQAVELRGMLAQFKLKTANASRSTHNRQSYQRAALPEPDTAPARPTVENRTDIEILAAGNQDTSPENIISLDDDEFGKY